MAILFQVTAFQRDTVSMESSNYLMRKFMNHSNHGLMSKRDFRELIIIEVSHWQGNRLEILVESLGAAKTLQRKGQGSQDFGANYKIVPMSSKSIIDEERLCYEYLRV